MIVPNFVLPTKLNLNSLLMMAILSFLGLEVFLLIYGVVVNVA